MVQTEDYGLVTWSGRSDCPPTGRSNIGFNVRFRTPTLAAEQVLARLRAHRPFETTLRSALDDDGVLTAFMTVTTRGDRIAAT